MNKKREKTKGKEMGNEGDKEKVEGGGKSIREGDLLSLFP